MIRALTLAAALCLAPLAALADARLTQLIDLLNLDAYVEISRSEGLQDAPGLAQDFLGQTPDPVMEAQLRAVYDTARMRETVRAALEASLGAAQIDAALRFVGSETGQTIAALELAARRAMSDPAVEEAARDAWARAPEEHPALAARIGEVIAVSDLVERNVTGALNSNLRFLQGLVDGGGTDVPMADLLASVRAQEEAIRAETEDWLGAYLLLAFQPLEDAELQSYIRFYGTAPGRALNAAMFGAFNQMYDALSYATARVIALRAGTEEL